MSNRKLIGPFSQILTMANLPLKGPIRDDELEVIDNGGILIEGELVVAVAEYNSLKAEIAGDPYEEKFLSGNHLCIPGLIDAHTHICYGGSRAKDYASRNAGRSYLEIAKEGGGIWDTVTKTRKSTKEELVKGIVKRANRHLKNGTTTIEVKSGYGLSTEEELKMLQAIAQADTLLQPDLIATCLAAHTLPKDQSYSQKEYLNLILEKLLPLVKEQGLSRRIDIFIEDSAFGTEESRDYLLAAKALGFDITVHADQFSTGGSAIAVEVGALSADHLEASTEKEISILANSDVIATALPGASLGLGCNFTPARQLLDAGCSLAIASDHNPGSAPMGDLLTQAAVLGAFEKLSNAEVLAGITTRAAAALNLGDRGSIVKGKLADLAVFHTNHYNEILYNQGNLKPCMIWKKGTLVFDKHKK